MSDSNMHMMAMWTMAFHGKKPPCKTCEGTGSFSSLVYYNPIKYPSTSWQKGRCPACKGTGKAAASLL